MRDEPLFGALASDPRFREIFADLAAAPASKKPTKKAPVKKKKAAVVPAVRKIAPRGIRMSGSEVSISIMEPMIMAATPPRVSTPCETTLISAMNMMMASRMRRTPA